MLRAEFLCSISRQYLLGWEKMEMPSDTSVAEGENLQCLQDFASPHSAAARHNVKIPVDFSRFCARLAEFSTSTADFCVPIARNMPVLFARRGKMRNFAAFRALTVRITVGEALVLLHVSSSERNFMVHTWQK